MKTPKEFYEMHHPIDIGIETKEGCVKMMEAYANYTLQQVKKLNMPAVVGRSEQLVCDHPDEAIIRDKPTDYCMACNSNI